MLWAVRQWVWVAPSVRYKVEIFGDLSEYGGSRLVRSELESAGEVEVLPHEVREVAKVLRAGGAPMGRSFEVVSLMDDARGGEDVCHHYEVDLLAT